MADRWAPDEAELRRLDALYRPFPSFAAWVASTTVNEAEWGAFEELLRERREQATSEQLAAALQFVLRAAALDTGAIEGLYTTDRGFTFTVAQQALHWERQLAEQGPLAVELFQAQLHTYELVLDAATQRFPITEAWIRQLHAELTAPQSTYEVHTSAGIQNQPLPKGEYKRQPNHVLLPSGDVHAYAPVGFVGDEMHRLVSELNSPAFQQAHPVHQASYAHYGLVVIHPFADGNGRTSRALASTYFYRSLSVPLAVLFEQRGQYLDSLEAADRGDAQPFVSFIGGCAADTAQLVLDSLETDRHEDLDDVTAGLRGVLSKAAHRVEMDGLAKALLAEWEAQLNTVIREASLPTSITAAANTQYRATPPLPGHRELPGSPLVDLQIGLSAPAKAVVGRQFKVFTAVDEATPFPFLLRAADAGAERRVRLAELSPTITPALKLRLQQWARSTLVEMLSKLTQKARRSLEQ
jgi:Fic family protein